MIVSVRIGTFYLNRLFNARGHANLNICMYLHHSGGARVGAVPDATCKPALQSATITYENNINALRVYE